MSDDSNNRRRRPGAFSVGDEKPVQSGPQARAPRSPASFDDNVVLTPDAEDPFRETTLAVERLTPSALRVVQTIDYDVKYGYVSALTLEAAGNPAPTAPGAAGLRVRSEDRELETEVRDNLRRILLKEPRRGRFSISVEHVVATDTDSSGQNGLINIPILQSVDAPYKSTMIRFPDAGPLRLADAETGWQSWLTRSGDSVTVAPSMAACSRASLRSSRSSRSSSA